MADKVAEIIRAGYEEAFAGNPSRLVSMTSDEYRHYGADTSGVYREFTAAELMAMAGDVMARAEATNEVVQVLPLGDEIVLVEVRGTRRSRVSDDAANFRFAILVNIVGGSILRTLEVAEQPALDFWRSMSPSA